MSKWVVGNNGAKQHMWFVFRRTNGNEYYRNKRGHLIRFGCYDSAQKQAEKLNCVNAASAAKEEG